MAKSNVVYLDTFIAACPKRRQLHANRLAFIREERAKMDMLMALAIQMLEKGSDHAS